MISIRKPQKAMSKALTDEQLSELNYPMIGSPKLDGIRCVISGGQALSSTLKPLGNEYIQRCLSDPAYEGLDGELIVGDASDPKCFNNTTGAVRRKSGEPEFTFHVFDTFENKEHSYINRWINGKIRDCLTLPHVRPVDMVQLENPQELLKYESQMIELGYEGIMVRSFDSPYKEGRTTFREQNIFKRKPVFDDEATIIGFIEQTTNNNEKSTNELGVSVRSSHKENKIPNGTLGTLIVKSDKWKESFHIGACAGDINDIRQEIWENQEAYLGKIITYKYQGYGSIDKPRLPIVKGFRDKSDITDY
jgi:DNA ligase-1